MADDPWVGTVLAKRYRIESPYYRTTKAELYRGLDLGTQAQVVVHLANGEFSQNSQFTSQFEQDARRLRTLEHPAIIPVLEHGRERDRLFMVCPFLPGGSLEQQIRRQWSVERTNEVVERIGEALAYLHGQELVHLNVSADSILFDEESRPHLSLGFGRIGRAIDPAAGRGNVYVLPEQARLNYVLADPKVDVYAFGVVLWLMLLGQPPYLDTPLDKQLIESGQKVELPDSWRAILERAISSNPERRFNSMPEFLAAWRQTQDQAHPSFWQRAQQKAQEGRNAAAQYLYGSQTQSNEPDAAAPRQLRASASQAGR